MKIAITGAAGLFGKGLQQILQSRHEVIALRHTDLDITNAEETKRALAAIRPEVIIHTAALPDIDYCEDHPDEAYRVNVEGTRNVVAAAIKARTGLVHISTDAVFDGAKGAPYVETDSTNPISVYGRTKLEAEHAVQQYAEHWIFRVSVLFGPGKDDFVYKAIARVRAVETHVVASDQMGSATYTLDAGQKIIEIVAAKKPGLYHLCNAGPCSRLELAKQAVSDAGLDAERVQGVPGASMRRPGPRVKYAVMEMKALRDHGFATPRPWQEALKEYISIDMR